MSEYARVTTAEDLLTLDGREIDEGYYDARWEDLPEPGNNRSRSYWHGWVNGRNDRDGRSDPEQIALIKDMRAKDVWPFGPVGKLHLKGALPT